MQERPPFSLRLEAFAALSYRALTLACTFAAGVLIARALGPENKGVLALVVLAADAVARMGEAGLTGASVYALGKKRATLSQVHGNLIVLAVALSGVLLAGYAAFGAAPLAAVWPGAPRALLLLGVALAPLSLYVFVWRGVMSGSGMQRPAQRTLFRTEVLLLAALVALVAFDAPLWAFAVAIAGAYALRAVAASRMFLKRSGGAGPSFDRASLLAALRFGCVSYAGALFLYLLYRFDQLFVAHRLGMKATGLYSVAAGLAEYPWIATGVIANSVLHLIARPDEERALTATCEAARQSLLLSLGAVSAALLFARPVVLLLYSSRFAPSVTPLLLLLPGIVAIAVAQPLLMWIAYHRGRPGWAAAAAVAGFALHVPLLFLLVPRHGIAGAAVASSAGYAVVCGVALAIFCLRSGRSPADVLLPRPADFSRYGRLLGDLNRLRRGGDA